MNFGVNQLYILDLRDDFIMNYDKDLYEFIDGDPIKAYQLGIYATKWFDELSRDQQYLHAKYLRHINEDILLYNKQIQYWSDKFSANDEQEIDLIEMCDYIYSNLIWLEDEDIARIKVALFLGMITGQNIGDRDQDADKFSVKNFKSATTVVFNPDEEEENDEI